MARGEGCGGHGEDASGVLIREEGCEWCGRWDWAVWRMDDQKQLAKVICRSERCGITEASEEGWYDTEKDHWRRAGTMLDMLLERGLTLAPAPGPCASCGEAPAARIHQHITPAGPGQHPYLPVEIVRA